MFLLKDILGTIIAHFDLVSILLSIVFQQFLAIDPQISGMLSIDIPIERKSRLPFHRTLPVILNPADQFVLSGERCRCHALTGLLHGSEDGSNHVNSVHLEAQWIDNCAFVPSHRVFKKFSEVVYPGIPQGVRGCAGALIPLSVRKIMQG
jgi:hypothetical protein